MKNILKISQNEYKLNLQSIHGIKHWQRVEKIGLYLAIRTKADKKVISLFAYLHDCKREDEDGDPLHGLRSAEFVEDYYNQRQLNLTLDQLHELVEACRYHSNSSFKTTNITVQTCLDADRLDLWRLDIEPDPKMLYTEIAKSKETIELARSFNLFFNRIQPFNNI